MHFAFVGKGFTLGVFCCTNRKTKKSNTSVQHFYLYKVYTYFITYGGILIGIFQIELAPTNPCG